MPIDNPSDYSNDNERTVFIPNPSGRAPTPKTSPIPPPYQSPQSNGQQNNYNNNSSYSPAQHIVQSGINPLVTAAAGLIALPAQLSIMPTHDNVENLRSQILEKIKTYENDARAAGIETDINYTARYVICTFIDEAVLNTLWGSDSPWTKQSLLSTLHNEANGGETFFVIIERLLQDPNGNIDLLELMFICISLGFKGRYAVMDRGYEKLEELRNVVFNHIRRCRGDFPQALSPHWQSQSDIKKPLRNYVPLWVVTAVASALLLVIFLGFTLVLDETMDPVYESLTIIANFSSGDSSSIKDSM